jgi:hypothetical protein
MSSRLPLLFMLLALGASALLDILHLEVFAGWMLVDLRELGLHPIAGYATAAVLVTPRLLLMVARARRAQARVVCG